MLLLKLISKFEFQTQLPYDEKMKRCWSQSRRPRGHICPHRSPRPSLQLPRRHSRADAMGSRRVGGRCYKIRSSSARRLCGERLAKWFTKSPWTPAMASSNQKTTRFGPLFLSLRAISCDFKRGAGAAISLVGSGVGVMTYECLPDRSVPRWRGWGLGFMVSVNVLFVRCFFIASSGSGVNIENIVGY